VGIGPVEGMMVAVRGILHEGLAAAKADLGV